MIEATPTIDPVYAEIDRLLALEPLQLRPGHVWGVSIALYIDRRCSVTTEAIISVYNKFFTVSILLDIAVRC